MFVNFDFYQIIKIMKKKNLVWFFSAICLISFIFPFFLKDKDATLSNTLSLAFSSLSATATVATLIIAVLLYQQFTIDSILVERQTNKVLELIDLLKGQVVYIGVEEYDYLSRFDIDDDALFESKYYLDMAGLTLITRSKDFETFFDKIVNISYSYWMPEEIKAKMEFLKITGFYRVVEKAEIKNYAKLKVSKEAEDDEWLLIMPNLREFKTDATQVIKLEEAVLTVNEYIASKNILIKTIVKWLEEKSNIKLDFKMYEPDQSIIKK